MVYLLFAIDGILSGIYLISAVQYVTSPMFSYFSFFDIIILTLPLLILIVYFVRITKHKRTLLQSFLCITLDMFIFFLTYIIFVIGSLFLPMRFIPARELYAVEGFVLIGFLFFIFLLLYIPKSIMIIVNTGNRKTGKT